MFSCLGHTTKDFEKVILFVCFVVFGGLVAMPGH